MIVALLFVLCLPLGARPPAHAEGWSIPAGPEAFEKLEALLLGDLRSPSPRLAAPQAWQWLNQIRNHRAVKALILSLPENQRPSRVFYAASGSHLAPLVAAVLQPGNRPFLLVCGEVDPGVEAPIDDLLLLLSRCGLARAMEKGNPLGGKAGRREWRFHMGDRPVTLRLVVEATGGRREGPLEGLASVEGCDLAVTHDWSGDPIENLRLVLQLLGAARRAGAQPPMLMMEDLEAHPYPADLAFFSPVARTSEPYGHREALALPPGCPKDAELGVPLYGGGVLLSFRDPWWKEASDETLAGAFDFLLFNQFDELRQNVLTGGDDPLLSPAVLDWWTGFGMRAVGGGDVRTDTGLKAKMVRAAGEVLPLLNQPLKKRWACRMGLYRSLLELEAGGKEVGALMPSARWTRRPSPGRFPTAEMERLFEEAAAHSGEYPAEGARVRARAEGLLPMTRRAPYANAYTDFPLSSGVPGKEPSMLWRASYEACLRFLEPR